MKYMLLIYGDEGCWTEVEREACMIESMGICDELALEGKLVASAPLHSVLTATSLQIRDGKRFVTDGPFAETIEQLGGYYVIDVDDLDEAIAIASRLPPAKKGTVEIRPIFDVSGLQDRNPCDLVSRRDLPFAIESIFEAFANPERLARWWGPSGFTNTFEEFDFRKGGQWRFVMHGPDGTDYTNHSIFQDVVEPERIELHHISPPRFEMHISLLKLTDSSTSLAWRMRFETPQLRDEMAKICVTANEQNFDRLTEELRRVSTAVSS